jgi:DNA-nicking Smr family endonuclease
VSRKPALIKIVNLEEGMPTVHQARLRLEHELATARKQGYTAVKLIHGYGSSGAGGVLRTELQKDLREAEAQGVVQAAIAGEQWRTSEEKCWILLQRYPEWKQDSDLGRNNRGISMVVL